MLTWRSVRLNFVPPLRAEFLSLVVLLEDSGHLAQTIRDKSVAEVDSETDF